MFSNKAESNHCTLMNHHSDTYLLSAAIKIINTQHVLQLMKCCKIFSDNSDSILNKLSVLFRNSSDKIDFTECEYEVKNYFDITLFSYCNQKTGFTSVVVFSICIALISEVF